MSDFLVLQNVRKTYSDFVALDSINLSVAEGEFVSFLGPSGCGKTTTLRMIGGFATPTSGKISFEGKDIGNIPPFKRDFVHTVFQDYALFPHLTVGENVAFGLQYAGISKSDMEKQAREALATVGLEARADDRPNLLSGGQKQRVALARALALRPKVLLLDEPLSALDAKLREEMQIELKRLHQRIGIAFVFVTHSQREALVMSDRVVLMNQGNIIQEGSPEALYSEPETLFSADFIGDRNFMSGVLSARSDTQATATVEGLEIAVSWADPKLKNGDAATIMIDPEALRLSSDDGIKAQVNDHQFLGQTRRLMMETKGGQTLNMDCPIGDTTPLPKVDEWVTLTCATDKVRAFAPEMANQ